MAAQYVEITRDRMDEILTCRGFVRTIPQYSLEYAYDKKMDEEYTLRIFSSVDIRTNKSRDKGADAIRFVVLRCITGSNRTYIVSKETRVNRSEGWEIRVNAKIDKWNQDLVICPQCGNQLVVRVGGKYRGKFYGCITYPKCGYTETIK